MELYSLIDEIREDRKRKKTLMNKPVTRPNPSFEPQPSGVKDTGKRSQSPKRSKKVKRSRKRRKQNESDTDSDQEDKPALSNFPSEKLEKKLRELGEPIMLFAESNFERVKRLKIAELERHEKKTSSKGIGNVFRDIQNKVEEDIQNAEAKKISPGGDLAPEAISPPSRATSSTAEDISSRVRADFDSSEDFLLYFFNRLLKEWEQHLITREIAVKQSHEGKHATSIQKQSEQYLSPLFELLRNKGCSQDIVEPMGRIAKMMQQREYVRANNEYLTMSIGNAPWPMGLTMVSIHERKGRSMIASNQIAHIMNDEETRKYIQSVKRLLTFCQQKYPPKTADKKF